MMSDNFLALLAPYFARKAGDYSMRSLHPHRILTDRPEPLDVFHARLRAMHAAALYGDPERLYKLAYDTLLEGAGKLSRCPSKVVVHAMHDLLQQLIVTNKLAFGLPHSTATSCATRTTPVRRGASSRSSSRI